MLSILLLQNSAGYISLCLIKSFDLCFGLDSVSAQNHLKVGQGAAIVILLDKAVISRSYKKHQNATFISRYSSICVVWISLTFLYGCCSSFWDEHPYNSLQ